MLRLFCCYLEEDNFGIWQVQKIKSDKTCLVYTKSCEKSIHNDICILFPVTSRLDTISMSVIRKPHRFFDSILFSHPLYFEIEIKAQISQMGKWDLNLGNKWGQFLFTSSHYVTEMVHAALLFFENLDHPKYRGVVSEPKT